MNRTEGRQDAGARVTYTRSASLRWHRYLTREATLSVCGMARRRYGDARHALNALSRAS